MGKGTWHLVPTTAAMPPTVTKHFERAGLGIVLYRFCGIRDHISGQKSGLEIMAGQRTMSGLIGDLTGKRLSS